jgi:hypothetical protein
MFAEDGFKYDRQPPPKLLHDGLASCRAINKARHHAPCAWESGDVYSLILL